MGEILGAALVAGLFALVLSVRVEIARYRAKRRGRKTFVSPISGDSLEVDVGDQDALSGKRCRYCGEEARFDDAIDCSYCHRTQAYE